ncbi:MAG TPA: serine/threonine-protein kinase, partial [Ktedonobacteraceae bacterium]
MANLEGAMLSDYLLLECTSRGSVADVYRARQNDGQYEVAVKIFNPTYAGRETFREYFLREAEKIGQFDHPHILPFIEYGEGKGLLYSVTPFVKSGTLDELLKRVGGKFSAMQAQPIVQQLCDAVQYAHDHEAIHGNIKPRNVFVANDGRMLLADFGITRGYADGQQTFNKMEWGATQYAAPEQSLGLLRRSSDIYALGAVFFRLLTGAPVFVGQTPVEVLLKHVRQEPPLVRSLVPDVSDAVDEVLQKALSKRSEDRYITAMELSQAFAAAVAVAPVASPVARSVNLATHPLSFDPQMSFPTTAFSIATQPTAPI